MEIFKEAQKNFDYMVRIRRHMHEYPEMTGQEFETLEFIKKELDALGIEYVEVPDGGIVGQIHGGKPGKTVLMRADMDALPIQENTKNLCCDKLCVSKNDICFQYIADGLLLRQDQSSFGRRRINRHNKDNEIIRLN